ncbi:glucosaminidase domain-containing protein [uncultured Flavobacterium sp.]|uniref:glucosaminidase domain-containing protein n=1 Tax=uncultured Flavobacterium sp. TaxID=165435 RepID=UPI0030CA3475
MNYKMALFLCCAVFFASCGSKKNSIITKKPAVKKTVVISHKETHIDTQEKLEATSFVVVTFENVEEYITWFKGIAKQSMINYKIPASITLAQGILESGAGKGELCKKANNHFGIKCHLGWEGDKVFHDDDESQECFRKYNNPADSYKDHSLFLTSRSRYNFLFDIKEGDYEAWANGLKQAGYATDPKYPLKLIHIIEKYKLYIFDDEVLGYSRSNKVVREVSKTASDSEYEVIKGDTLYSISKKLSISLENLMKKNNISDPMLSVGQILKIK